MATGDIVQGYTYSVFSVVAIAIHLIFNFSMLAGRDASIAHGARYRGFLFGVLAYYVSDAAWGIFAGLGWKGAWYVDSIFFFLSMALFVFMWGRFVSDYLEFGKRAARIISWSGCALLAFNVVTLAVNPFIDCLFHFDAQGVYQTGIMRNPTFGLLIGFVALVAAFVLAKVRGSRDDVRRRSVMAFIFCIVIALAIILQVIWPLTPFTALGCLVGNCFFHVFVLQDEQAVKHMAELECALERARSAEKARSMFFSIMSHDIRTPLNAILGYSELLQRGLGSQSDRDEAFGAIHASATMLLKLVSDVLDLAKLDAGKMELRPGPVKLSKLVDEVFAAFRALAAKKGVALAARTADVPTTLLDEQRIRRILFNLIGNAVKFTDSGSVTISATYADSRLKVSVSDTGCGIPPESLANILDPYCHVQDLSHAANRVVGTGLGLPICRRLVEAMGGNITVESELGVGTTFRVCIPCAATTEKEEAPQQSAAPAKLLRHVLVVDDSAVNRSVLVALLKKVGVTLVGCACDGVEALAELDAAAKAGNPYDLVLSDYWMPNMNGLELVESLRADSRFARLPVFAVTADMELKGDARSSCFTDIILKPMTTGKLIEVFNARRGI